MKSFNLKHLLALGALSITFAFCNGVFASALNLPWAQPAEIGESHSGDASNAETAGTAVDNPAGLVRIKKTQIVAGLVTAFPDFKFVGSSSSNPTFNPGEFPTAPTLVRSGSGTANGSKIGAVPTFSISSPLYRRVVAAFSIYTPFGLEVRYDDNSFVRYDITRAKVATVSISPAIGVAITDKLSIGVGADIVWGELILEQKFLFPQIAGAEKSEPITSSASGIGQPVQILVVYTDVDATVRNEVDGWAKSFHAGLLYQFSQHTRIGLAYVNQLVFHGIGKSTFSIPGGTYTSPVTVISPDPVTFPNQELVGNNLKSVLRLPQYATLSVHHEFNDRWTGMASVKWTCWSGTPRIVEDLVVTPGGPGGLPIFPVVPSFGNATLHLALENTWEGAIGTRFHQNENLFYRIGFAIVETPTVDAHRDINLPGARHYDLGLGVHWQALHALAIDLSYSHLFFDEPKINISTASGASTVGHLEVSGDIVAIQFTYDVA